MEVLTYLQLLVQIILYIITSIANLFKPSKQKDIRGQLALITGGANGIGKAIAQNLAAKGCNIAIVDLDIDNGRKTAAELANMGVKAKAFKADIGKLNEVEQLKVDIEQALGPIDILVNNAGIHIAQNVTEEKVERLEQMLNANLVSHIWTVRVFLPGMIERKRGHILAICSLAGIMGTPEGVMYSTTKFAVRGFMESLTLQLHFEGYGDYIKTTTAFPYFVDTRPCVKYVVKNAVALKKMYTSDECGRVVVNAVLKEKEIVMLPEFAQALYFANMTIGMKKVVADVMLKKGFDAKQAEVNGY